MREFTTKHKDILNYWIGKSINKNGEVLLKPKNTFDDLLVVLDPGEPSCWACNKSFKSWDKLERAHIKPRALSRDDSPNNLFLLCSNCHFESPDYMDSKFFYMYIYDKSKRSAFGFDTKIISDCISKFESLSGEEVDFSVFNDFKIDTTKINTHGSQLVDSTLQAMIINFLIESHK